MTVSTNTLHENKFDILKNGKFIKIDNELIKFHQEEIKFLFVETKNKF